MRPARCSGDKPFGQQQYRHRQTLLKLTADPRYLGARPGFIAVLHTWTRAMLYHPHVHVLVTARGWRPGSSPGWVAPRRAAFLVPGRALSVLFRAKLRDALRRGGLHDQAPACVWRKSWVVHLKHAGIGEAVLSYLARYVYLIALVNSRLERFDNGRVTFRYRDNRSGQMPHCTLQTQHFMARFLQHVLPAGFTKVRSYGLFAPSKKTLLERARAELCAPSPDPAPKSVSVTDAPAPSQAGHDPNTHPCPVCGVGRMRIIETHPRWRRPP